MHNNPAMQSPVRHITTEETSQIDLAERVYQTADAILGMFGVVEFVPISEWDGDEADLAPEDMTHVAFLCSPVLPSMVSETKVDWQITQANKIDGLWTPAGHDSLLLNAVDQGNTVTDHINLFGRVYGFEHEEGNGDIVTYDQLILTALQLNTMMNHLLKNARWNKVDTGAFPVPTTAKYDNGLGTVRDFNF